MPFAAVMDTFSSMMSDIGLGGGGTPSNPVKGRKGGVRASTTPTPPVSDIGSPGATGSVADIYQAMFGGGTVAPTAANSAGQLDAAATSLGQQMVRGRTSTMLTGGQGENEALLKTSQIMLGR